MNHYDEPDYDTGKFGRRFAELFFADPDFQGTDCIVLENVCAKYIEKKRTENGNGACSVPDSPKGNSWERERNRECFELVVIQKCRVLAAVSVAELPRRRNAGEWYRAGASTFRREAFLCMVEDSFEGMGFVEIDRRSCGYREKERLFSGFLPDAHQNDDMPVKMELGSLEPDDYLAVKDAVLKNMGKDPAPVFEIRFRTLGQGLCPDQKELCGFMREGMIRRPQRKDGGFHLTSCGRRLGLIRAYRGGKGKEPEQVVMAVDDNNPEFSKIRRWELGQQSVEEELEMFG